MMHAGSLAFGFAGSRGVNQGILQVDGVVVGGDVVEQDGLGLGDFGEFALDEGAQGGEGNTVLVGLVEDEAAAGNVGTDDAGAGHR